LNLFVNLGNVLLKIIEGNINISRSKRTHLKPKQQSGILNNLRASADNNAQSKRAYLRPKQQSDGLNNLSTAADNNAQSKRTHLRPKQQSDGLNNLRASADNNAKKGALALSLVKKYVLFGKRV
jgi:hypothetical protein